MFDGREYQCYLELNGIQRHLKFDSEASEEDKKMQQKIPFNSLQYQISNQPRHYTQRNYSNSTVMHSLTIVRDFDYLSPHIAQSVPSAKDGNCSIEIYRTTSENESLLFIKYELKTIQVLSVHHELDGVSGHFKEVITIGYKAMDLTVIPVHNDKEYSTKYAFTHVSAHS
ncbi:MAG: type VI secretion system tube protein Hcp [Bdellovibrionota bacterium]